MTDRSPEGGTPRHSLPLAKKLLFAVFAWILALASCELMLATAGIQPGLLHEDPYVGFASSLPLFVEDRDLDGRRIFATADNKRRFFNSQEFLAAKPSGGKRLFCLGGSTTYGRPYSDETSFCGWLREMLRAAEPDVSWEVVNAGGISYASYRVASLIQELSAHEPDYFVVYAGHNEFLEERTYGELRDRNPALQRVESVLRRTRIDAALRGVVARARAAGRDTLSGEVSTILDQSVGPAAYHRDDALRRQVLAHYRFNLERMVGLARAAGAEVLLVAPASNLLDCAPFKSESSDGLSASDRERFAAAMTLGRAALEGHDAAAALDAFRAAVELDPRHADAHYGLGRSLVQLGDAKTAEASLLRARDEDVCPLRALSAMRDIVLEVASELEVPLFDFEESIRAAQRAAGEPIAAGADWFLDHVHPTIEGHRHLALGIFDRMVQKGWLAPAASWGAAEIERVSTSVHAGIDTRSHGLALRNLAKVLSWAGKSDEAARVAEQALEQLGDDAECYFILGVTAAEKERYAAAVELYQHAIAIEPDYLKARNNLGTALVRLERDADAISQYEIVLAHDPEKLTTRFNLANALLRSGQLDGAIAHYREVLRLDPADADAYFNLARSQARKGDWHAAEAAYREVLRLNPGDEDAREGLARAGAELEETSRGEAS